MLAARRAEQRQESFYKSIYRFYERSSSRMACDGFSFVIIGCGVMLHLFLCQTI